MRKVILILMMLCISASAFAELRKVGKQKGLDIDYDIYQYDFEGSTPIYINVTYNHYFFSYSDFINASSLNVKLQETKSLKTIESYRDSDSESDDDQEIKVSSHHNYVMSATISSYDMAGRKPKKFTFPRSKTLEGGFEIIPVDDRASGTILVPSHFNLEVDKTYAN